jgi:hypothetical protein
MASPPTVVKPFTVAAVDLASSNLVIEDDLQISTGDEPHISLNRIVVEKKTGQVIRHASADFHFKGKSLSDETRSLWDLMLLKYDSEHVLAFSYTGASVISTDNIPDEFPKEFKELLSDDSDSRRLCASVHPPLLTITFVSQNSGGSHQGAADKTT